VDRIWQTRWNPVELSIREHFCRQVAIPSALRISKGCYPRVDAEGAGLPSPKPYVVAPSARYFPIRPRTNGSEAMSRQARSNNRQTRCPPHSVGQKAGVSSFPHGLPQSSRRGGKCVSADFDGSGGGASRPKGQGGCFGPPAPKPSCKAGEPLRQFSFGRFRHVVRLEAETPPASDVAVVGGGRSIRELGEKVRPRL